MAEKNGGEAREGGVRKRRILGGGVKFFLVAGSFVLLAGLALTAIFPERCSPSRDAGPREEEEPPAALSVFWETPSVTVNVGEVAELRWISDREIRPRVVCEGSAVAIIAAFTGGVRIRAIEGGTDVVTLSIEGQETVCVITVNGEKFAFMLARAELGVGQRAAYGITAEPEPLLSGGPIIYTVYDTSVADVEECDNYSVTLVGLREGVTLLSAEWRGKRTEMEVEITGGAAGVIEVPYRSRFLHIGQRTELRAALSEPKDGDAEEFVFIREAGKGNVIEISARLDMVAVTAAREGTQSLGVIHPRAKDAVWIRFDVLPSQTPPPPAIGVGESPLLMRVDQIRDLEVYFLNGPQSARNNFTFRVAENAYAVEAEKVGGVIRIRGMAPGAAKLVISNPSAVSDYEVMVVVDERSD